jgi:hypothetical protein
VPKQTVGGDQLLRLRHGRAAARGGDYDLYFTLEDQNDAEEGDFSPVVSVPLDRDPTDPPGPAGGALARFLAWLRQLLRRRR